MSGNTEELAVANPLKAQLRDNNLQIGLWSSLCSNIVAEVLSYTDLDWVLFDAEHSPNDLPGLFSQLQAMKGSSTVPIVRPPWNDPVILKQLLDIGFHNFIIPFVQTEEEAKQAVAAVRYPPAGIRGVAAATRASKFGFDTNYWHNVNDLVCVFVQVETAEAVKRLDAICAVDGVDGVFIGPNDLAASIGRLMESGSKEVQDIMAGVPEICAKHGVTAGTLAFGPEQSKTYMDMGYTFVGLGADIGFLKKAVTDCVSEFK
jgi:2-keto-3-deoxy-L-rhamnonate aldolase RhmA